VLVGAASGVTVGLLLIVVGVPGIVPLVSGTVVAAALTAVLTSSRVPAHRQAPNRTVSLVAPLSFVDEDGYRVLPGRVGAGAQ
jgi:hypothetical protein